MYYIGKLQLLNHARFPGGGNAAKIMILKTAVGTYEKPFVLMYRSMNGFSYVHLLGFAPKPVHPSIHQGERALGPRNCDF